jgi:hypothetical protein
MGESKKVPRRTALAGVGALGAVATAAVLLPEQQPSTAQAPATGTPNEAGTTTSGYRLTEHIQRYYASARI